MSRRRVTRIGLAVTLSLMMVSMAAAESTNLVAYQEGAAGLSSPDYDWWYGCSPTSAGMMMGYYDLNSYGGLLYTNLVPGGPTEAQTYIGTTGWDALSNNAIASQEHVEDFYSAGYLGSGDDVDPSHSLNCLADFMGTSQDAAGNKNGSTAFYFQDNGAKFYAKDAWNYGVYSSDGMFGMYEYFLYAGYGSNEPQNEDNFYNQLVDTLGLNYGFTLADYKAEIDAGRVVLIHVEGHSMLGYGYDDSENILVYDTWDLGGGSMSWGGSYSGRDMFGVTCFEPYGGAAVPVPPTILLLGSGLLGLAAYGRRKVFRKN